MSKEKKIKKKKKKKNMIPKKIKKTKRTKKIKKIKSEAKKKMAKKLAVVLKVLTQDQFLDIPIKIFKEKDNNHLVKV